MMRPTTIRRSVLLLGLLAPCAAAQGIVSGQVSLLERTGDTSSDLADALVWLEPVGTTRLQTVPTTERIQLKGRQFSPRVRAVPLGSTIEFPNDDSFSHNVFSKTPEGAFDTGVYPRGRTKGETFREAGIFPIYCNIHPRMTGYVIVLKTPYYAQAGDDGRYTMTGVPAGTYMMHLWHDRASQEVTKPVTVGSAGMGAGRVELDVRGYRFVQHKNKFGQEYKSATGDRY